MNMFLVKIIPYSRLKGKNHTLFQTKTARKPYPKVRHIPRACARVTRAGEVASQCRNGATQVQNTQYNFVWTYRSRRMRLYAYERSNSP